MTPEQKDRIDRLSKLQGDIQRVLQQRADYMGRMPQDKFLSLPQDKWDQLFSALEQTEQLAQRIGDLLEQALKNAGVDIDAMQKGHP
jgi:hypothetical protein